MSMLAIKGHNTRGKEVIALLEMLGGVNTHNLYGDESYSYYTIDSDKEIKGGIYVCGDEQLCHFTLEEFEKEFPYKIGDKVKVPYEDGRITGNELYEYKILKIKWDYLESMIKYGLPSGNEQRIEYYSTDNLNIRNKKETAEEIKIDIPKGYKFAEVDDDNQQVVFTRIQPQYPKTYEECCEILNYIPNSYDADEILVYGYMCDELRILQKLLVCRNAYWKIAGWNPKVKSDVFYMNTLPSYLRDLFPMPTEEMRDAFLENFKELIELCKKLL